MPKVIRLTRADYAVIAESVDEYLGFDCTTQNQQTRITLWARGMEESQFEEDHLGVVPESCVLSNVAKEPDRPDWVPTCPCGVTVLNQGDLCTRCEKSAAEVVLSSPQTEKHDEVKS